MNIARWRGGIHQAFAASRRTHPDRPAVEAGGRSWTYAELDRLAGRVAATLEAVAPADAPPFTGVFAPRGTAAYAGILATLYRGQAYVPVAPEFPAPRARYVLERSGVGALVVDPAAAEPLVAALEGQPPRVLLSPLEPFGSELARALAGHRLLGPEDLVEDPLPPREVPPEALANLLFTSGSTGTPKGVMVSHGNLAHFLAHVTARYPLGPSDRFSQLFELVFDLHGFDLHAAWSVGACVVAPDREDLLFPARYARARRLTVWFSVPSTGVLMQRTRFLEPGAFPDLRVALFCGEALMVETAAAMQAAAPDAVVDNLYGPTEVTLACLEERYVAGRTEALAERGAMPIGRPYPGLRIRVVDPDGQQVAEGEAGELCVAGPQVTPGYFEDPERTARAFGPLPGVEGRWYRTGDRVRRPVGDDPVRYLGRVDHQCQVNGYRVELGEVEAALRDLLRTEQVVVVGVPPDLGRADYLVAFTYPDPRGPGAIRRALGARLPAYMVPREIRFLDDFPTNTNGKVDRVLLGRWAQEKRRRATR